MLAHDVFVPVCQYCNYSYHDGWTQLLQYDETYQTVVARDTSTYGFHESWDDLREEVY